jgi:hypothetical protein
MHHQERVTGRKFGEESERPEEQTFTHLRPIEEPSALRHYTFVTVGYVLLAAVIFGIGFILYKQLT